MIQETSLQAYFGEVIETLGMRQHQVLGAFTKKENFTNTELASFLQWPINTVTPRCLELRERGLVTEHCKRKCKVTGRSALCWEIKPLSSIQVDLFGVRQKVYGGAI